MATLLRNTTLHFSRRSEGYQPLDQSQGTNRDDAGGRITFLRRKSSGNAITITPFSHKRDRARKRLIYLQTYKLTYINPSTKERSRKLNKAAIKVRSLVVSFLSFVRAGSLRSCNSGKATSASSPSPIRRCF